MIGRGHHGPRTLQHHHGTALLRQGLRDAQASHPSARRDWLLQGDAGLAWLADQDAGEAPPSVPPPPGLGITLRPYQRLGLDWLQQLRRHQLAGILADDMGLGKTAQALAHLLVEQQAGRLDRPALVVAPASLLFNWQAEAARVDEAADAVPIQVLDQARPPEWPSSPRIPVWALAGALAGLLLVAAWVLLRHRQALARLDPAHQQRLALLQSVLAGRR